MLHIKPSISKRRQQSVIQSEKKRQLLVQEIQSARCWAEMKKKERAVARANASWKENYNPFPDESAATRTNEKHGNQRVMQKSSLGVFSDIRSMMFQSLDSSASQVSKIKTRKSNILSSTTVSRRPFHSHHQNQIKQLTEPPFNTTNANLTPYHPLREMEIGYAPVLKPNRNKQQCMQFRWVSRDEAHVVENTRQLSVGEMISEIYDEGSSRDTFLQSQPQRENIFAPSASNASAFVRYAPQVQHEYDFSPPVSTPIFETTLTPQRKEFDFYTHDDNLMNFEASSELLFGSQTPAANFSDYFRESRNERPPSGGLELIRTAYSFSQEF